MQGKNNKQKRDSKKMMQFLSLGNYSQLTRNPRRTTSKNMRSRVYNKPQGRRYQQQQQQLQLGVEAIAF